MKHNESKKESENTKCNIEYQECCGKRQYSNGGNGAAYFLGFIGAAIFYIGQATTFWAGVLGLLKAMVWPAFLVY